MSLFPEPLAARKLGSVLPPDPDSLGGIPLFLEYFMYLSAT